MGASDVDLRREAALSGGANVVILTAELAVVALLARALGPAGAGTYFIVVAAAAVAAVPVGGVGAVVRKRGSEAGAPTGEYVTVGLAAAAVHVGAVGVAAVALGPRVAGRAPAVAGHVAPFVGMVAARAGYGLATKTYDALGRPGLSMWTQALRETVFVALLVVGLRAGVTAVETVWLRAGVLVALSTAMFLTGGVVPRLPARRTVRRAVSFGVWSVPRSVIRRGWGRLPTLALGAVAGPTAVGFYESAARLAHVASYFATCVNDPLLVLVSNRTTGGEGVRDHLERAVGYAPLVAVPTVAVTAVLGGPLLVALYGPEYRAVTLALVLLAAARLVYAVDSPLAAALLGADRPRPLVGLDAVTLAVGGALVVAGAALAGPTGVAAAALVVEAGRLGALQTLVDRAFDGVVVSDLLAAEAASAAVAGGVVGGVARVVDPSGLVAVGALCALLFAGYAVGLAAWTGWPTRRVATVVDALD